MSWTGRVAAVAVCLGVSLVLTASRSSRAGDEKEDKIQEALQGAYACKATVEDGVLDKDPFAGDSWRIRITGNVLEIQNELYEVEGLKWRFRLDPEARPRHFDMTCLYGPDKGQKVLGIYKFEKDELTFVVAPFGDRPSSFKGGKGLVKMVLVKKSKR
jgi:uncharacterized protein (TIGR03067 family)